MSTKCTRHIFACSAASLALGLLVPSIATAQEAAPAEDGAFLGTIELGESKRAVQTETATPLTIIEQEEMADRQAGTIAELVESVPGVEVLNGSSPTGSGIVIRGFGANGTYGTDQKVAILVDGATVGSEEIYRIGTQLYTDPDLYKSVSVIRGTVGSYEYGSGIIGGVVMLETKDASDYTGGDIGAKFSQTLGWSMNGNGFNSSSTIAWQPTENLELLGNYTWREQDAQEDGDGNDIDNNAFELPSYLLKAKYTFGEQSEHSVFASYTNSESADRDVPYNTFSSSTDFFGNVDRDTKSETLSAGYTYNPVDNDLIDLEAIFTYANQDIENTPIGSDFGVNGAHLQYETTKLTIKNGSYFETGPFAHNLRSGVEYIHKDRLPASSAPGGTDERYALFLIDELEFLNGWSFTPALRYETQEIDGQNEAGTVSETYENSALMGGASLRYQFGNGLSVFTSYAYTESLPILDDLETVNGYEGNYMEQPEISNTFEAGFAFDRVGLLGSSDVLAVKTNYYDTIVGDVTSYSGAGDIYLEGIEIESSYALENGFYIDLNGNVMLTADERGQGPDAIIIDWDNSPSDSLRFTAGKRFGQVLDVSWEVVAVDDMEVNDTDYEGYTVHNLRATVRPDVDILQGTAIRVSVENAFDEAYTPVLATRPAVGQNLKLSISKTF